MSIAQKTAPAPIETSVQALHSALQQRESCLVLDVREKWEQEICVLPNVLAIPLGSLPAQIENLPAAKDSRIYVMCHHGGRSLQAALYLQALGFTNVSSVKGGMHHWALEIDSTIPTY